MKSTLKNLGLFIGNSVKLQTLSSAIRKLYGK